MNQVKRLPIADVSMYSQAPVFTVRVHAYPDGTLAVFHGPRCLARYRTDGQRIEAESASPRRSGASLASDNRPIVDPGAIVRGAISAHGGQIFGDE